MSDAFVLKRPAASRRESTSRPVLITGAAGNIGSHLAEHSAGRYELTLMVHPDADAGSIEGHGTVVRADLTDLDALKKHGEGIDTVVHLAACPSPDTPWDPVLRNNIIGTYNAMVAAVAGGCRRVVYASSIHAVSGYPVQRQVQMDDPVNPGDLYGVSKCFGEAMGRFIALQQGVSAICVRIGAFQPIDRAQEPDSVRLMNSFVSRKDLTQLLQRCIDDEQLQFAIVAGLSDNPFNRMNIQEARELLGYDPHDDLTAENPKLEDLELSEQVQPHSEKRRQKSGIRQEL